MKDIIERLKTNEKHMVVNKHNGLLRYPRACEDCQKPATPVRVRFLK